MIILNFTQHNLTKEQIDSLVEEGFTLKNVETEIEAPEYLKNCLTFTECPSREELNNKARALADYAQIYCEATDVIVGGAPYFMGALETALIERGIKPRYAFTERVAVETVNPDGSTTKTSIFRHSGWVV